MSLGNGLLLVIIVLTIILLSGMPDGLHAATCPGETVVALLDAATAYNDIDRAQIMPEIESMASGLESGQRLLVCTVGTSIDDSLILFDRCVPAQHSCLRLETNVHALYIACIDRWL